MHFLLGLTALVLGVVIATRRTRPGWFVIVTGVLVGIGALFSVLSFTRVTDGLGIDALNVIGWIYVGLSLMTMLASIFVLERRGPRGEELPPLIGDNPFDGDTDDSDDPAPGTAPAERGTTPHVEVAGPRAGDSSATTADVDPALTPDPRGGAVPGQVGGEALPRTSDAGLPVVSVDPLATRRGEDRMHHDEDHHDGEHVGGTAPAGGDTGGTEPIDGTVVVGADPDIATPEGDEALRAEATEDERRDPAGPEDARRPEQP